MSAPSATAAQTLAVQRRWKIEPDVRDVLGVASPMSCSKPGRAGPTGAALDMVADSGRVEAVGIPAQHHARFGLERERDEGRSLLQGGD
ncbi:hypothetical protein [Nocardia asiatica]|uniref:hypothetical protein n=1 Tax=Nocardia asiatica TaxID=209252 RepID=UPI0005C186ED|nr:hypothetical protein [Nocardia asiatica]